jgi:hypothetical protein
MTQIEQAREEFEKGETVAYKTPQEAIKHLEDL